MSIWLNVLPSDMKYLKLLFPSHLISRFIHDLNFSLQGVTVTACVDIEFLQ